MGAPPAAQGTTEQSHLDIVAELHQIRGVSVEDMAVLNEPIVLWMTGGGDLTVLTEW